jgi:hypothetical protein
MLNEMRIGPSGTAGVKAGSTYAARINGLLQVVLACRVSGTVVTVRSLATQKVHQLEASDLTPVVIPRMA